jgi:hypothetical protein
MAAAKFNVLGSRFDAFLYAPVREDADDGLPLTVLSFLARLNIDPWEEAARLAQLPGEAAARLLAPLIAALPDAVRGRADAGAIAARLIALLPRGVPSVEAVHTAAPRAAAADVSRPAARPAVPQPPALRVALVFLVWMALLLIGQWIGGRLGTIPVARAPAVPGISAPAPAPAPAQRPPEPQPALPP